ncbi:unnamed protein product [Prunus armeniaca]
MTARGGQGDQWQWRRLLLVAEGKPAAAVAIEQLLLHCSTIIYSEGGSRSPSSQVPLYLWGGSKVHKKRFVTNLHRATSEAHFQKWCATYASVILDDVHIKLAASSIDDAHCVDLNELDARIITFCPFYFSLGFALPFSKFFRKVFYAMECAPSQLRRYEKYAQICVCKDKLFDSLNQGDHVWHADVLEVSGMWEGEVGDAPLVLITYCDENDICKKLDLGSDMAKGCRVLNIPATRDACMSNLLKTNFLSSPCAYVKLVDHIHYVGELSTFSSLSLEMQNKEVSAGQIHYESRMSEVKESMSVLKRSTFVVSARIHLLTKFNAYKEAIEQSKFEAIIDAYKLGYMDCKSGFAHYYHIEDEDVEMFCLDMLSAQGVQINATNMEVAVEQVAYETVVEEEDAKEGAIDEVVADLAQ